MMVEHRPGLTFVTHATLILGALVLDQEFSVGGTLAKWAQAGSEIISVVITSGDSGSNDPTKDGGHKQELAALREREQLAANKILGIKQTIFLRYPDGELEPTIALRKDLTRLIRQFKPDTVTTGNPEGWFYGDEYLNHPDHRAAAEAACEAVFPSAGTRGSYSQTCLLPGMSRTMSAGCTSMARKIPIPGWTSPIPWTSRSRHCSSMPARSIPMKSANG